MIRSTTILTLLLALTLTLAACGGGETEPATTTETPATEQQEQQDQPALEGEEAVVENGRVTITPVGNQMKYEQTSFTVQPGQEVTIVFENTATSPAMQHNVVVLDNNEDATVQQVGQAALAAGADNSYIPPESVEEGTIIAHTPLAQPGETVEVTFTAPEEPGAYRYICTFPGHYMMMQGVMRVEA